MPTTLKKAAFRRWLESFPPDQEVGKRVHASACPIARHLFAVENAGKEYPERHAILIGQLWWRISVGEKHKLQPWARRFVDILDNSTGTTGNGAAVTAQEALDLLSSL